MKEMVPFRSLSIPLYLTQLYVQNVQCSKNRRNLQSVSARVGTLNDIPKFTIRPTYSRKGRYRCDTIVAVS